MDSDAFENIQIRRLLVFLYLVPVFGFFPACWTLYRRKGDYQQRCVSRLAVTLTLVWLSGYTLLGGAQVIPEGNVPIPLLLANGLLTSGYFLVNLWLMIRLWRRRSLDLLGISRIARHLP